MVDRSFRHLCTYCGCVSVLGSVSTLCTTYVDVAWSPQPARAARDALILLILSNYFETAYFWQSRLRCLNIEHAAGGAGSGLLGDAFTSQHLSIIQPQPRSQQRVSNTGAARCDLMIQCNQTLYQWQHPAQRLWFSGPTLDTSIFFSLKQRMLYILYVVLFYFTLFYLFIPRKFHI